MWGKYFNTCIYLHLWHNICICRITNDWTILKPQIQNYLMVRAKVSLQPSQWPPVRPKQKLLPRQAWNSSDIPATSTGLPQTSQAYPQLQSLPLCLFWGFKNNFTNSLVAIIKFHSFKHYLSVDMSQTVIYSSEFSPNSRNHLSPHLLIPPLRILLVLKNLHLRTYLVAQWLWLHAPKAGVPGSTLGQGTKSHMPLLKSPYATTKTQGSQTNKIQILKKNYIYRAETDSQKGENKLVVTTEGTRGGTGWGVGIRR